VDAVAAAVVAAQEEVSVAIAARPTKVAVTPGDAADARSITASALASAANANSTTATLALKHFQK
jgi:hypothetical protein